MIANAPTFATLRIVITGAILRVVFDHPPLNLMDSAMLDDLDRLGRWLEDEPALKVVLFESNLPDFFIAHADLRMLDGLQWEAGLKPQGPSPHQLIVDRFRTLPQVTVGKVAGIARGGGSEFLLALDMRFGAIGHAVLGQPEVALGFPPGCGATQRLPRLVGRAHALEIILGCGDYSAEDAARIGWLNRALPPDELTGFVNRLVQRIAGFPAPALVAAKQAIAASTLPLADGLCEELHAFLVAFATQESKTHVRRALGLGFQTEEVEGRSLDAWLPLLAADSSDCT